MLPAWGRLDEGAAALAMWSLRVSRDPVTRPYQRVDHQRVDGTTQSRAKSTFMRLSK
jgi:hypothetical protein